MKFFTPEQECRKTCFGRRNRFRDVKKARQRARFAKNQRQRIDAFIRLRWRNLIAAGQKIRNSRGRQADRDEENDRPRNDPTASERLSFLSTR